MKVVAVFMKRRNIRGKTPLYMLIRKICVYLTCMYVMYVLNLKG